MPSHTSSLEPIDILYSTFLQDDNSLKLPAMNIVSIIRVPGGGWQKDLGEVVAGTRNLSSAANGFVFLIVAGSPSFRRIFLAGLWSRLSDNSQTERSSKIPKEVKYLRTCIQERTETSGPLRRPIRCDSEYSVGLFSS